MKTRSLIALRALMVVGAALITAPATGADTLPAPAVVAQVTPAPPAPRHTARHLASTARTSPIDRVEARITELRAKLSITPAQETLWDNVTLVMRDNANTMDALRTARSTRAQTMTAVDDLTSYGEIVDAHAAGLRTLIPAFTALYDSMSDPQKMTADAIFHGRGIAPKRTSSKTN
jgi:hypothetical protein